MNGSILPHGRSQVASLLLLLCLAPLLPAALKIFLYQLDCIAYPYQLDPEEGFLVAQALELRHGRLFYRPLTAYPFLAGTYAPLLQTALAALFLFAKPGLAAGRGLVLLSSLGCVLCCAWLLWRQTRNAVIALVCPLFFYVSYEMVYWGGFCRVDLPAIFLNVLALAVLFHGTPRRAHFVCAGMLFLAAAYTKQIQLAAPIAASGYWLTFKDTRKNTLLLLGIWVGGGAALFLILNLLTRGQFYVHTVVYNANEFDWLALKIWSAHLWFFYKFLLLAIPLALAVPIAECGMWTWYRSRKGNAVCGMRLDAPSAARPAELRAADARPGFFLLYWLVCLGYVLGSAKQGATANYFLEPLLATALLVGIAADRLLQSVTAGTVCSLSISSNRPPDRERGTGGKVYVDIELNTAGGGCATHEENTAGGDSATFPAIPSTPSSLSSMFRAAIFCCLLAPLLILHGAHLTGEFAPGTRRARVLIWMQRVPFRTKAIDAHRNAALAALQLLQSQSAEIYCELPILNILARRPLHLQAFIMSRLAREGKWDQRPFVEDLLRRRFKYLILTSDLERVDPLTGDANYTAEMVQAMQSGYRKFKAIEPGGLFNYYFYERLPAAGD